MYQPRALMPRIRVLNGAFDAITLPDAVEWAAATIRSGARGYICTVNVAILMMMRSDPRLQAFVDRAGLVVADGQPLVWASRALGTPLPARVAGIDLADALAARAQKDGFGVYLLGAQRDVIPAAARRLTERWPGLRLCGIADEEFSADLGRERARAIARSGANILLVGMGVPRQEYFIEDHWDELGVSVAVGVGGTFYVMAGVRRRAPAIVQRLGLEWLFRLGQEPRRLWRRYAVTNPRFVYLMLREFAARLVCFRSGR
jgi:N-acetylglucosaminyldiphosphoundecaprenol N-acetyl-beta-D-mannosaminyltransferase